MTEKAKLIWSENGTWLEVKRPYSPGSVSDMGKMDHKEAMWFAYGKGIDFLDASGLHRFSEGRRIVGSPVKASSEPNCNTLVSMARAKSGMA